MTNKPEVLGFFVEWSCNNEEGEFKLSLDHFTTRDDYCSIFGGGCRLVPVIRLSDYEALQAECEKLRKDAERYRWLRMTDWWGSPLCAVRNPARQVKLGSDCPSLDRLDAAIDAAMRGGET